MDVPFKADVLEPRRGHALWTVGTQETRYTAEEEKVKEYWKKRRTLADVEVFLFDGSSFSAQQGDITHIEDVNGNVLATYEYDAWGKIISSSGSLAELNPCGTVGITTIPKRASTTCRAVIMTLWSAGLSMRSSTLQQALA